MNKKVLFLIDNMTTMRMLLPVIDKIIQDPLYSILVMTQDANIGLYIEKLLFRVSVVAGHNPNVIDLFCPDLVVCYQIWWWGLVPVLAKAKSQNIPIVMYDHGSILYNSNFLLEGSEEECYRADIRLCSHVICWSQRSKETWVSHGVLEEKIHVTGAAQLDMLYEDRPCRTKVYEQLGISQEKKIILLYTTVTGQIQVIDTFNRKIINEVESCLSNNSCYQLVLKSHPAAMLFFNEPPFIHSKNTILIANIYEDCKWEGIVRINADDVLYHAYAVVGTTSSVLINPLICNIPIIHIELPRADSHDFSEYSKGSMINITNPDGFSEALKSVEIGTNPKDPSIIPQLNYKNDGKATERIIALLNSIIEKRRLGHNFYLTEENELLTCVYRYPFLPYPYKYLINYYSKTKNFEKEDYWVKEYCRKFKDPFYILKEVADYHFNVCNDQERSKKYSTLYNNYIPIDTPPLVLYKKTIFESLFRKIRKIRTLQNIQTLRNIIFSLLNEMRDYLLCQISFLKWVKKQNLLFKLIIFNQKNVK